MEILALPKKENYFLYIIFMNIFFYHIRFEFLTYSISIRWEEKLSGLFDLMSSASL